jgi:hypothetical protein
MKSDSAWKPRATFTGWTSNSFMTGWKSNFGPFDGETWLNCSHQGPLPKPTVEVIQPMIGWKQALYQLPIKPS